MTPLRIAFYAPLKGPDHPTPSGDRQMARQLVAALEHAGHRVSLLSRFRSFATSPDPAVFARLQREAEVEANAVAARWSGERPDLLFTYHLYYKAPDLLGPPLAARFGLPYVTAEASHAAKRAGGPWQAGHALVESAVRSAAINFCFTANDRAGLAEIVDATRLIDLPPFIDASSFKADARSPSPTVELLAVAMMRPGDKLRSYAFLAAALARLADLDWRLSVVGDGPERAAVERLFASLPTSRVRWLGTLAGAAVASVLAESDIFVWPGFNEAFGMAYLEAQACGLPVVAVTGEGTPSVVRSAETGLLTEDKGEAYAAALRRLIEDPVLRARMGRAAERFIHDERTLERAAKTLDAGLRIAMEARRPAFSRSALR